MPFTIRVELHGATTAQYAELSKRLAGVGVVDVIRSDDGRRFKMPPAEYDYAGAINIETLRQTCSSIAASVCAGHAVLVTHGDARSWVGLQQIT